jgi:hypothetical protein
MVMLATYVRLLFADDMADISDNVIGLQRQINVLHEFCEQYGMQVNLDKTYIMVFRRGGCLRHTNVWNLSGMGVEVVSYYIYI